MAFNLFDDEYETVSLQRPLAVVIGRRVLKLRSVSSIYDKYKMSDIFEFNDKLKHREEITTPTTNIPESVSEESVSTVEANLDELKKLITLDIRPSILA